MGLREYELLEARPPLLSTGRIVKFSKVFPL
jgi:hypothetical protein